MFRLGQKMIHIGNMVGKPAIAYIRGGVDDYLVRMCETLEGNDFFFVHIAKLKKEWRPDSIGIQGCLFTIKSTREKLREKFIRYKRK